MKQSLRIASLCAIGMIAVAGCIRSPVGPSGPDTGEPDTPDDDTLAARMVGVIELQGMPDDFIVPVIFADSP